MQLCAKCATSGVAIIPVDHWVTMPAFLWLFAWLCIWDVWQCSRACTGSCMQGNRRDTLTNGLACMCLSVDTSAACGGLCKSACVMFWIGRGRALSCHDRTGDVIPARARARACVWMISGRIG